MITAENLPEYVDVLSKKDKQLAMIADKYGTPPLWKRDEGFHTLIHLILEQQVSLASALAAYNKLKDAIGLPLPKKFLHLSDSELKTIGFSRQKTEYGRVLANSILSGELNLKKLSTLSDDEVRQHITSVKGLGPWTANIYLLMAMGRPDVWPSGDLALAVAVQRINNLDNRPSQEQLEKASGEWKPYRSVAARMLWHYYLSEPRRNQV